MVALLLYPFGKSLGAQNGHFQEFDDQSEGDRSSRGNLRLAYLYDGSRSIWQLATYGICGGNGWDRWRPPNNGI
jgi:hypothetical protein